MRPNARIPDDDPTIGKVCRTDSVVHISGLSATAARGLPYYAKPEAIRSVLAAPVRMAGEVQGVILVDSAQREEFAEDEIALLDPLGEQIEATLLPAKSQHAPIKNQGTVG